MLCLKPQYISAHHKKKQFVVGGGRHFALSVYLFNEANFWHVIFVFYYLLYFRAFIN